MSRLALWLLGGITVGIFLLHFRLGSQPLTSPTALDFGTLFKELLHGPAGNDPLNGIVWSIRLPRALACLVVGGILGVVGSAFQALFRNPLAEPYIVGVSAGAAVGGAFALALGFSAIAWGLGGVVASTLAGMGALFLVFLLARRRGYVDIATLLLAGVVISTLLSALLSVIVLFSDRDTNNLLRWLMGSMSNVSWGALAVMTVALVGGSIFLVLQSRRLNAFALGEEVAQRLGVNVRTMKTAILVTGSVMTAVTVGPVGVIGFVGLVAPHLARRTLGVDWRASLPGALLLGSCILLAADIVAVQARPATELPVGVVTAIIGAPFLLALLRR